MMFKMILLILAGASYGLLAAAGVFTVLAAVGLVPRFAGKTHTGDRVFLYEEAVVAGTIVGGAASLFGDAWTGKGPVGTFAAALGVSFLAVFGLFCGMFVGCLALAIAEMLDSIPILARRVFLRHGIGLAILSMAIGKLVGSLYYFANGLYHAAQ